MTQKRADETWVRIAEHIATKPDGAGREVSWLADRMQTTVQRIQNWKARGVPAAALPDIAAALGWTINQVLGMAEPPSKWPFETIDADRFARLTPRQAALVELAARAELDRIEASSKQQVNGA